MKNLSRSPAAEALSVVALGLLLLGPGRAGAQFGGNNGNSGGSLGPRPAPQMMPGGFGGFGGGQGGFGGGQGGGFGGKGFGFSGGRGL